MNNYKSLNHCKYLVQYHLVWCPKFRYSVLKDNIEESLRRILAEVCKKYQYEIIELEVMPDHIHVFISVKPTISPTDIVRTLKSITAVQLFKEFPVLKKFYSRCGSLVQSPLWTMVTVWWNLTWKHLFSSESSMDDGNNVLQYACAIVGKFRVLYGRW